MITNRRRPYPDDPPVHESTAPVRQVAYSNEEESAALNVLKSMHREMDEFNKSLKNEGILFVGSTEQIILSYKYCLKPVKTFFYVKEKEIQEIK
jgi:hypothetical protein